jgi:hypothetical protein
VTEDRGVGPVPLVTVEDDLAGHVVDLLGIVGVPATREPAQPSGLVTILVPAADVVRARASIDLVLPGLLAEEAGELLPDDRADGLSGRLIRRSDWQSDPEDGPQDVDARTPGWRSADDPGSAPRPVAQEDDDFVPPPPPPIPRAADHVSRFAWLGAIGGPILMIIAALMGLGTFLAGAGLAAFIVGFGVLVSRMPDGPRQDDGWDDGAVL